MSSTVGLAAMDRHLKKVYDCLNIGCNKKAVQEVDRLPKNVRDLTVFKALKALALIRISKRKQASDILKEINPENDLDEVTLQTMTSCYKESADVAKIIDLYEAASRRKPNDPEIMAHLFMAHVRVFNFKRQKEIALQMYKTFAKKRRLYSFWAIMSLVMQAQADRKTENSVDTKVCLSLAEKMCEKMMDDERTHEEIELYLTILRKQNKSEEEYKFLSGPTCLRITDHLSWINRRRAYLCFDLKMHSRAFKYYFNALIHEYPDQLEYYQGLVKSALLLESEAQLQQHQAQTGSGNTQITGTPVKTTSALAECYDIIEKQCLMAIMSSELQTNKTRPGNQPGAKSLSRTSSLNPNCKPWIRGPFIARCELYHTILSNEEVLPKNVFNSCKNQFATKFPSLNSLLLNYFQGFSRKVICFYDMDYMIKLFKLSDSSKSDLLSLIDTWIQTIASNQEDFSEFDMFHITMNFRMLSHAMHPYQPLDTKESRLEMAKKYIDEYDASRHLGKNANKTEFQVVDNYCLLAINSIMTNAVEYDSLSSQSILSDSVLMSLTVLAENAIVNSPSNHQIRLCLLKLYTFIGASKPASDVLLSLEIRHFQIDTLGHLLNPVFYDTGHYTLSKDSLDTCLEFYSHGIRDCIEGLTTSYRDGRFSKIEEISSVLWRLTDSLNAAQCFLLQCIVSNLGAATTDDLMSACQSFDSDGWLHRTLLCENHSSSLKDNRDFAVLKSLNFEVNDLVQLRKDETLADEQLWMKLRYHLLKSAYAQLEPKALKADGKCKHSLSNLKDNLKCSRDEFESLRAKITSLMTKKEDKRYSFLEPEASPFRLGHVDFNLLLSLASPIVFTSDPGQLTQEIVDLYAQNLEKLMSDLEHRLGSIDCLVKMKEALKSLTISVEFLSLCGTSLIALSNLGTKNQANAPPAKQPASSQSSQAPNNAKAKSIPSQMLNKTEAQLTKLANLVKAISFGDILGDVTSVESTLVSDPKHSRIDTKAGSLFPLMSPELTAKTLVQVKDKIADSYAESLREIEATCRRKAKLFRASN